MSGRQRAVIKALVAAAAPLPPPESADRGYILIKLSQGCKHMRQVLFECTQRPKRSAACTISVQMHQDHQVCRGFSLRRGPWRVGRSSTQQASTLTSVTMSTTSAGTLLPRLRGPLITSPILKKQFCNTVITYSHTAMFTLPVICQRSDKAQVIPPPAGVKCLFES